MSLSGWIRSLVEWRRRADQRQADISAAARAEQDHDESAAGPSTHTRPSTPSAGSFVSPPR